MLSAIRIVDLFQPHHAIALQLMTLTVGRLRQYILNIPLLSMENTNLNHNSQFQLERLILFSDAVFAIAITLLVIEMKIPHIDGEINDRTLGHALVHLIPVFFGFVLSFVIIGIYWTVHHRIFGQVINYDGKLLWLNLFFLFSIVLMPFTSALYGEYYQPNILLPHLIYTINICLTGFCNVLIIRHINDPFNGLKANYDNKQTWRINYAGALMMPVLLTIGLVISCLTIPWIGRISPVLMPLYMAIAKKSARNTNQDGE